MRIRPAPRFRLHLRQEPTRLGIVGPQSERLLEARPPGGEIVAALQRRPRQPVPGKGAQRRVVGRRALDELPIGPLGRRLVAGAA